MTLEIYETCQPSLVTSLHHLRQASAVSLQHYVQTWAWDSESQGRVKASVTSHCHPSYGGASDVYVLLLLEAAL